MTEIVIASAARTPVGSFNGAFASLPAHALGTVAIKAAMERAKIGGGEVDEVILGQILAAGSGQNPARQASVNAGIPVEHTAFGINQLCGSGLRAVALAAQQVSVLQTLSLSLDDVAADGVHVGGHRTVRLLDHTARAARAQVELRRRSGGQDHDKLLPLTDRAVSTALNQASLDFGICVHGRKAERHVHPGRWLARLGITAVRLP